MKPAMVAVVSLAAAALVVGCGLEVTSEPPRATTPPGRPSIRDFAYQTDGEDWTVQVVVNPGQSPTKVSFEYGVGDVLDQHIVIAEGLIDPGQVSITTDAFPTDWRFCGLFTATNEFGSDSLEVDCRATQTLAPDPSP